MPLLFLVVGYTTLGETGRGNDEMLFLVCVLTVHSKKRVFYMLLLLRHTSQTRKEEIFSCRISSGGKNRFFYSGDKRVFGFLFCFFPHRTNFLLQDVQETLFLEKLFIWETITEEKEDYNELKHRFYQHLLTIKPLLLTRPRKKTDRGIFPI